MENQNPKQNLSYQIALRVFQDTIMILARWIDVEITYLSIKLTTQGSSYITTAKKLTQWPVSADLGPLQLVFDAIKLKQDQPQSHFWPAIAIHNDAGTQSNCPNLNYPLPQQDLVELDPLKAEIKAALQALSAEDWQNLSILTLILEKYGSYLSYGQADIALFDLARVTAAIAVGLADQPEANNLCLVAGDLSGIQPFIYTIASDGALKSLRARSFYLELMTEELTQQLLERLALPRTSVIYTGGGKSYLLAPATARTHQVVADLKTEFNQELFWRFQGKVSLNLASYDFPTPEVGGLTFSKVWEAVNKELAVQKTRKFDTQIEALLKQQDAHEPCGVCHRDDVKPEKLKSLGGDGVQACCTCNRVSTLGEVALLRAAR
jgi:CRISPR-associated protein Csm1